MVFFHFDAENYLKFYYREMLNQKKAYQEEQRKFTVFYFTTVHLLGPNSLLLIVRTLTPVLIVLVLIVIILVESHWKEDGAGNEKLIQLLTPWGTLTKFICFPSSQIIHLERRDDNICFTYLGVFRR